MKNQNIINLFILLSIVSSPLRASKSTELYQYKHGGSFSIEDIKPKIESRKFVEELVYMYKNGVAKPIKKDKIRTYFIVGPSGSGKSTFIFACQGNDVYKKESDNSDNSDDWRKESEESKEDETGGLVFQRTVKVAVPKAAQSATGVTAGSKIYYMGEKTKNMTFCDTEGFLGIRKVKSYAEIFSSSFYPFFTLNANKIGGIVVIVSAADIESGRGTNFRLSARFIQQYFGLGVMKKEIETLKKSLIIFITKSLKPKSQVAKEFRLIMQESYQNYYRGGGKKGSGKKTQKRKDNTGDLKHFFSLFLKKDVKESEIHKLSSFVFNKNVRFFDPCDKNNVKKAVDKLSELNPLDRRYLSPFDGEMTQYFKDKVLQSSHDLNKKSLKLLKWKKRVDIQKLTLESNVDDLKLLRTTMKNQKELMEKENETILLQDDIFEPVCKDTHVERSPFYRKKGFWANHKEQYNRVVFDKGLTEGTLYSEDPGIVSKTASRLTGVLILAEYPVHYPLCALLSYRDYSNRGYLSKYFVYSGREKIFRIRIKYKNAKIEWIKPKQENIEKYFSVQQREDKDTGQQVIKMDSLEEEGIKKDEWRIFHQTNYEEDANCSVEFFAKKSVLTASIAKIKENKQKIKSIIENINYINKEKKEDDVKKDLHANDVMISSDKKELLKRINEVEMAYFWATNVFAEKSTDSRLLIGHTENFEEAVGVKIIQHEENNQSYKPLLYHEMEGEEREEQKNNDENIASSFTDNIHNDYQSYENALNID